MLWMMLLLCWRIFEVFRLFLELFVGDQSQSQNQVLGNY